MASPEGSLDSLDSRVISNVLFRGVKLNQPSNPASQNLLPCGFVLPSSHQILVDFIRLIASTITYWLTNTIYSSINHSSCLVDVRNALRIVTAAVAASERAVVATTPPVARTRADAAPVPTVAASPARCVRACEYYCCGCCLLLLYLWLVAAWWNDAMTQQESSLVSATTNPTNLFVLPVRIHRRIVLQCHRDGCEIGTKCKHVHAAKK